MPNCYGGWVGDGSGTWTGSFDDTNMIELQRETNGYVIESKRSIEAVQSQVYGQYGLQASWDLLHGAQISWQAFLGSNSGGYSYTWYETARQVDGTNELVTQNSVELFQCMQKLDNLLTKADQIYTALGNVANLVNSTLTAVAGVRDVLTAFRDECYARLFRVVQSVVALFEAYLLPLYRICRADGSAAGDMGEVVIRPELTVTNGLSPSASDAVVSSASEQGIVVNSHKLSDYGLFYPLIGSSEMYYSDELRQVIARPYRNDGRVYLS